MTRHALYVCCIIEARSIDAVKKLISITYYEWAFLALGIQHEMFLRRIFVCGLPSSTRIFHIIS